MNINRNKIKTLPWIEKYRPTNINELVINSYNYNRIQTIIKDKSMPNLIITGVPGIGKTTTIMCIAKLLFGKYVKDAVLELNASDNRGIKSVQELITHFCKKRINIMNSEKSKYAKHKIIFLDEADNMTKKAQQLINNLMEKYKDTTRFAFTCNNSSDIIESIQSRCITFRYRRISAENVKKRLLHICKKEKVKNTDKGITAVVITSYGDMRRALNNLQMTWNGYKKVTSKNVYKICDRPHPDIITDILIDCKNKDLKNAIDKISLLKEKGFSCSDIILEMENVIKTSSVFNNIENSKILNLNEETKIEFMKIIGNTHLNISKGVNTTLQLTGCISGMILCK